jgi:SPP1 gp7 family putative phage head morphogenesis protein
MAIDLPSLARRQGRRRNVTLRPIAPTQAMATELARIMAPAWQVWREAEERILAGYDPAPLAKDGLTIDSPDAVRTAISIAASDFLSRLVTEITPALGRWVVRSEQIHRARWMAAIKAGTGVDLETVLTSQPVQETIEAFVNRNVALISNISDQAQARISDSVFRGYQQRTPPRELAKEVREATGMGRARSIRIAADQTVKLSAALDMERQAEAGIEQYKWRHSGKLHPRAEHRARDGNVYKLGEPAGDTPGQAPFCGCRAQAYLAIMDEL